MQLRTSIARNQLFLGVLGISLAVGAGVLLRPVAVAAQVWLALPAESCGVEGAPVTVLFEPDERIPFLRTPPDPAMQWADYVWGSQVQGLLPPDAISQLHHPELLPAYHILIYWSPELRRWRIDISNGRQDVCHPRSPFVVPALPVDDALRVGAITYGGLVVLILSARGLARDRNDPPGRDSA